MRQLQNQFIVLAGPTSSSQTTTESTNVTSAGNNFTDNDSGVSVNETTALETEDPGQPTTEINDYTDDTIPDDSTGGIL